MTQRQGEEAPKIAYAIFHAADLLNLLEDILMRDAALGREYLLHLKSLTYKLFAHCTTLLRLSEQAEAQIPFAHKSYADTGSVRTLVRVCVETYLTLFEVFFESVDRDTAEFRRLIWLLKGTAPGLLLQEEMPYLFDKETIANYSEQFQENKRLDEEHKKHIREHAYYRKMTQKQREGIEKKLSTPEDYFSIKYSARGRNDILLKTGLNKHIFGYIYSSTSGFIHSDGYSAWEASPFHGYQGTSVEHFYLFIAVGLIGKVIIHFSLLSAHYLKICKRRPDIFELAGNLTEELKRGRSEDNATTKAQPRSDQLP